MLFRNKTASVFLKELFLQSCIRRTKILKMLSDLPSEPGFHYGRQLFLAGRQVEAFQLPNQKMLHICNPLPGCQQLTQMEICTAFKTA